MVGLSIDEWGPGAWNTLHVFAHSAPTKLTNEEVQKYALFFNIFAEFLPCPRCRRHFQDFLSRRMTDDTLRTRLSIVKLLNDAHNEVNARRGKRVYTLEEHYRVYSFQKQGRNDTLLRVVVVTIVLGIMIARIVRHANVHT